MTLSDRGSLVPADVAVIAVAAATCSCYMHPGRNRADLPLSVSKTQYTVEDDGFGIAWMRGE